jgi:hypothetical protein
VDLTLREVENNMREAAKTAHSKLGQSDFSVLRTLPLFRRFNDIYGDERIFEYLYKGFHKFITISKTKIILSDGVSSASVFHRYFNKLPPFTGDGKKNRKGEFPDAFALEAVNQWCSTNRERAYLVSTDSDWHEYGKASIELFEDQPRLIALESITEFIEMVIRNDDALIDTVNFADTIFNSHRENIEKDIFTDIRRCKFVFRGENDEDSNVYTGVLNVKIDDAEIVSVNKEQAIYTIHLRVELVSQQRDNSWHCRKAPSALADSVVFKHCIIVPLTIIFSYKSGVLGDSKFEFSIPSLIEIDLTGAERISTIDWLNTLPVLVCGVENGQLTDTRWGAENFDNFSAAKSVFNDLDIWSGSSRFTHATGNKLSDELRFDTWKAYEMYST